MPPKIKYFGPCPDHPSRIDWHCLHCKAVAQRKHDYRRTEAQYRKHPKIFNLHWPAPPKC